MNTVDLTHQLRSEVDCPYRNQCTLVLLNLALN